MLKYREKLSDPCTTLSSDDLWDIGTDFVTGMATGALGGTIGRITGRGTGLLLSKKNQSISALHGAAATQVAVDNLTDGIAELSTNPDNFKKGNAPEVRFW